MRMVRKFSVEMKIGEEEDTVFVVFWSLFVEAIDEKLLFFFWVV